MQNSSRPRKPSRCRRITKRICSLALAAGCLFGGGVQAAAPSTSAKAHVLMEASTGRVLASKNAEEKLPMASTTKVMTGLLAVEKGNLDEIITVQKEAVGQEGSSMYLREGERLTLRELVYGLMLASGNDAAVQIALHIGGSVENFAKMMNERAREIGAMNTNFVTPNGLPNDDHYTTAYDLALISSAAMQNATFREIVGTKSMNLEADDDTPARYLRSKNKILYQFEGGNGVKTGYTKAAGKCLSAGAERGGMQLIAVVLNDYGMFDDCQTLLSYGFDNYQMTQIAAKGDDYGEIPVKNGILESVGTELGTSISLPLTEEEGKMREKKVNCKEELVAPVKAGTETGTVEFWLDGELYAKAPILTAADVPENSYLYNLWRVLNRWMGVPGWRTSADSEVHGGGGSGVAA